MKNDQNEILILRLLNKSIKAFIMGLEIYNKPTIKYKVEGFSFFICNAWELMLKAELLYRNESIYYKNNSRTLSLNEVIKKIYTDKKQPLRLNLESVIDLRNTSTHFVTEDYKSIYAPFFQACIMNFVEQIQGFHKIDITEYITSNCLRHTHASFLISEDIPIEYISKRLGHKSINITLEVYSHLLEESKEKHDEKLLKIL